jgi:endonuclease-3 related protein
VAAGAVLTQGTAWLNAEKAVLCLLTSGTLTPEGILSTPREVLAEIIRSAGYFNLKARKLEELARFFRTLPRDGSGYSAPSRDSLLSVWGIGPETADSILQFAFGVPTFVVDEYTRRIAGRLGCEHADSSYEKFQSCIEIDIPRTWIVHSEFHALLVEHAKARCRKKPACEGCPLSSPCAYRMYEISQQ